MECNGLRTEQGREGDARENVRFDVDGGDDLDRVVGHGDTTRSKRGSSNVRECWQ